MSFIEWLNNNIFNNGKKSAKITAKKVVKIKGEDTPFEMNLSDMENKPLTGKKVYIKTNGVEYERTTDQNGNAKLNINLNCGVYDIHAQFKGDDEYNSCKTYEYANISPRIATKDLTMNEGDGSKFKATMLDVNGNATFAPFKFTINGVDYNRTGETGELNINLKKGQYTIKTTAVDSIVENKITVNEKPAPPKPQCNLPVTQSPLLLASGSGNLGQKTGYSCGPHSLMQGFYNLTGRDISESTIMGWAGTTTAGTGHSGLNTAVAQFNRTYGENIKIKWCNLSDFGNSTSEQFQNIAKLKCEGKFIFYHLLYRNEWGHYETYKTCYNSYFDIANSLGSKQGSGYYGYIEERNYNTQRQYISGISQPSVCLMWKE